MTHLTERPLAPGERLLVAKEVDAMYGLTRGTAAAACQAGAIPFRQKRGRAGRPNYLIHPDTACREWGVR